METDHRSLPLLPTLCRDTEFRWGERTYIMGILNLSPDSFSGDGLGDDLAVIVARARKLVAEGADILDIGGESTRPGAKPVPADEELRRVIPAIEKVAAEVSVPLSIDTYKSEVAGSALRAGANMINDVWGFQRDPRLAEVAGEAGVPILLVSNQRQNHGSYDIMIEVISSLKRSIGLAEEAGIAGHNIIVDPGIGFGKSSEQNLSIIRRLAELKVLGKPILLGASRKFVDGVTSAAVAIGIANGADMVRVHDVRQMAQVARMSDAIIRKAAK